jgi:outer membrane lipoprotein SlyB
MGAPISQAGDRCDRRSYGRDDRAQYHYNDRGYGYGAAYEGYQDSDYRSGYAESGYRDDARCNEGYYGYGEYRPQRSAGKSAAIIGGSAAAGAAVGAMAGGGKGAAIGAAVGALGGLVYDRATKDRDRKGR